MDAQAPEDGGLGATIAALLPSFELLFSHLATTDIATGRHATEASLMRWLSDIIANYTNRTVVAGAFKSVWNLERQAAPSCPGVSLQGMIAMLTKVAVDAFSGDVWSEYATPADKLKLLLFLADPAQRWFAHRHLRLGAPSAVDVDVDAAAHAEVETVDTARAFQPSAQTHHGTPSSASVPAPRGRTGAVSVDVQLVSAGRRRTPSASSSAGRGYSARAQVRSSRGLSSSGAATRAATRLDGVHMGYADRVDAQSGGSGARIDTDAVWLQAADSLRAAPVAHPATPAEERSHAGSEASRLSSSALDGVGMQASARTGASAGGRRPASASSTSRRRTTATPTSAHALAHSAGGAGMRTTVWLAPDDVARAQQLDMMHMDAVLAALFTHYAGGGSSASQALSPLITPSLSPALDGGAGGPRCSVQAFVRFAADAGLLVEGGPVARADAEIAAASASAAACRLPAVAAGLEPVRLSLWKANSYALRQVTRSMCGRVGLDYVAFTHALADVARRWYAVPAARLLVRNLVETGAGGGVGVVDERLVAHTALQLALLRHVIPLAQSYHLLPSHAHDGTDGHSVAALPAHNELQRTGGGGGGVEESAELRTGGGDGWPHSPASTSTTSMGSASGSLLGASSVSLGREAQRSRGLEGIQRALGEITIRGVPLASDTHAAFAAATAPSPSLPPAAWQGGASASGGLAYERANASGLWRTMGGSWREARSSGGKGDVDGLTREVDALNADIPIVTVIAGEMERADWSGRRRAGAAGWSARRLGASASARLQLISQADLLPQLRYGAHRRPSVQRAHGGEVVATHEEAAPLATPRGGDDGAQPHPRALGRSAALDSGVHAAAAADAAAADADAAAAASVREAGEERAPPVAAGYATHQHAPAAQPAPQPASQPALVAGQRQAGVGGGARSVAPARRAASRVEARTPQADSAPVVDARTSPAAHHPAPASAHALALHVPADASVNALTAAGGEEGQRAIALLTSPMQPSPQRAMFAPHDSEPPLSALRSPLCVQPRDFMSRSGSFGDTEPREEGRAAAAPASPEAAAASALFPPSNNSPALPPWSAARAQHVLGVPSDVSPLAVAPRDVGAQHVLTPSSAQSLATRFEPIQVRPAQHAPAAIRANAGADTHAEGDVDVAAAAVRRAHAQLQHQEAAAESLTPTVALDTSASAPRGAVSTPSSSSGGGGGGGAPVRAGILRTTPSSTMKTGKPNHEAACSSPLSGSSGKHVVWDAGLRSAVSSASDEAAATAVAVRGGGVALSQPHDRPAPCDASNLSLNDTDVSAYDAAWGGDDLSLGAAVTPEQQPRRGGGVRKAMPTTDRIQRAWQQRFAQEADDSSPLRSGPFSAQMEAARMPPTPATSTRAAAAAAAAAAAVEAAAAADALSGDAQHRPASRRGDSGVPPSSSPSAAPRAGGGGGGGGGGALDVDVSVGLADSSMASLLMGSSGRASPSHSADYEYVHAPSDVASTPGAMLAVPRRRALANRRASPPASPPSFMPSSSHAASTAAGAAALVPAPHTMRSEREAEAGAHRGGADGGGASMQQREHTATSTMLAGEDARATHAHAHAHAHARVAAAHSFPHVGYAVHATQAMSTYESASSAPAAGATVAAPVVYDIHVSQGGVTLTAGGRAGGSGASVDDAATQRYAAGTTLVGSAGHATPAATAAAASLASGATAGGSPGPGVQTRVVLHRSGSVEVITVPDDGATVAGGGGGHAPMSAMVRGVAARDEGGFAGSRGTLVGTRFAVSRIARPVQTALFAAATPFTVPGMGYSRAAATPYTYSGQVVVDDAENVDDLDAGADTSLVAPPPSAQSEPFIVQPQRAGVAANDAASAEGDGGSSSGAGQPFEGGDVSASESHARGRRALRPPHIPSQPGAPQPVPAALFASLVAIGDSSSTGAPAAVRGAELETAAAATASAAMDAELSASGVRRRARSPLPTAAMAHHASLARNWSTAVATTAARGGAAVSCSPPPPPVMLPASFTVRASPARERSPAAMRTSAHVLDMLGSSAPTERAASSASPTAPAVVSLPRPASPTGAAPPRRAAFKDTKRLTVSPHPPSPTRRRASPRPSGLSLQRASTSEPPPEVTQAAAASCSPRTSPHRSAPLLPRVLVHRAASHHVVGVSTHSPSSDVAFAATTDGGVVGVVGVSRGASSAAAIITSDASSPGQSVRVSPIHRHVTSTGEIATVLSVARLPQRRAMDEPHTLRSGGVGGK